MCLFHCSSGTPSKQLTHCRLGSCYRSKKRVRGKEDHELSEHEDVEEAYQGGAQQFLRLNMLYGGFDKDVQKRRGPSILRADGW